MTMPNFLILGTMKAGTTSLYHYLRQHPQIYMSPVKSPDFFAIEGRRWSFKGPGRLTSRPWSEVEHPRKPSNIADYRALFRNVSDEIAVGEASPCYLYRPEAPSRIKHYIPEAKLIAGLRNPVDRAYSAFCHARKLGFEPLEDFTQALQAEEQRAENGWEWIYNYKGFGFYYTQLKRYYEMFERKQIKVYLHEDLKDDTLGLVQDIFRYLGVDDAFNPDISSRYNPRGVPKNRTLHRLIQHENRVRTFATSHLPERWTKPWGDRIRGLNCTEAPPLQEEVRRELVEVYRQDILKLQHLIQRDLSPWLQTD